MATRFPNGITADITGDVTGNVTGDVTGDVTGGIQKAVSAVAASGTITMPSTSQEYVITKAGVGTITLGEPTATTHDGIAISVVSQSAYAHVVTHGGAAGFNNNGTTTDVATFGGAVGDGFTAFAYQGAWYTTNLTNVTLG